MTRKVHFPVLATMSLLLFSSLPASRAADQQASFSRDISPVLSKKCFQCHGPDQEHRKGDLRLDKPDAEDGPFTDHDGYQSLVPGDLEKSELWYRITTDDEDDVMPPPDSNLGALTEKEKAAFKQWILDGAKYETFWAFDAPKTKEAPPIQSAELGTQRD
jgi:mono/diheme cytochrome c family protein